MFIQYEYFSANTPNGIEKLLRTTGLSEMSALVNRSKSMAFPAMFVEDAPDMKLDLEEKTFEDQQHTFYVLLYADQNDGAKRSIAYTTAFAIGKQILIDMNLPGFARVDKSDIFVFKVGPLADGVFGYGFSYNVTEE